MARTKGSYGRVGVAIKDEIWKAFCKLGKAERMVKWVNASNRHEALFYQILAKLAPAESHSTVDVTKRDVRELDLPQLMEIAASGEKPEKKPN